MAAIAVGMFIVGLLGLVVCAIAFWLGHREPRRQAAIFVFSRLEDRYLGLMLMFISVTLGGFGAIVTFTPDASIWCYWLTVIGGLAGTAISFVLWRVHESRRLEAQRFDAEARSLGADQ